MKITAWSRRIGLICLTTCIVTAIICRENSIASVLAGGLLILINPKE